MKKIMLMGLLIFSLVLCGGQASALSWMFQPLDILGSGSGANFSGTGSGIDGTGSLWIGGDGFVHTELLAGILQDVTAGDSLTFSWDIDAGAAGTDSPTYGLYYNYYVKITDAPFGGSAYDVEEELSSAYMQSGPDDGTFSYTFASDATMLYTYWVIDIEGADIIWDEDLGPVGGGGYYAIDTGDTFSASFTIPASAVPEPATLLLLGVGLLGLAGARRKHMS